MLRFFGIRWLAGLVLVCCSVYSATAQSADAIEKYSAEGQQALAPGKHTLVFDFKYDGPGFGKGGTGVLRVDDKDVATRKVPHTIPFIMAIDETFDVGVDTRTPVDDKDYQVPFRFTGKLNKLTFKLGPTQLTSDDHQVIQRNLAKARD